MYKKAITHPTKDNSSIKDEINLVSRLENKTVGSHEVGKRNRFGPKINIFGAYFSSVQSLSHIRLFATPQIAAHQAYQLPELTQTHAHRVSDAIQPSHLLSSLSPPTFNLSQHKGLFQ